MVDASPGPSSSSNSMEVVPFVSYSHNTLSLSVLLPEMTTSMSTVAPAPTLNENQSVSLPVSMFVALLACSPTKRPARRLARTAGSAIL